MVEKTNKITSLKEKLKDNQSYKLIVEKNEIEKKLENVIFKLKTDFQNLEEKNEKLLKENMMLKSDLEIIQLKNEECIIKIAEFDMHYKEVCERNIMLEKLLKKGSNDIYDQDYKSKKEKETLENLFSSEISIKNNGNNEGNNNNNNIDNNNNKQQFCYKYKSEHS